MKMTNSRLRSSFRDPSGFLFVEDGTLYRQVNRAYQADYDRLMQSGLYERLTRAHKLIPHQEVDRPAAELGLAYRILQPERVEFISYPYEWSFSELKDAALTTLTIQKAALEYGLSLKDASAYNVQFHRGRPVLIDSLSFETYREGEPWIGYRQFCQHFLAPLALMATCDVRLGQMLRTYIDGIPLDLASRLLPLQTRLQFGLTAHIHLHATAQKNASEAEEPATAPTAGRRVTKAGLIGLVESLGKAVDGLHWKPKGTAWGDYYDATNYSTAAFEQKNRIVKGFLERARPGLVWDLGANTGVFSRLAAEMGCMTVSADYDEAAVEKNYQEMRRQKETHLLPLVLDLTNPSPAIGWHNQERDSFLARGPADLVMALALVHHLAIANNVPLPDLAEFFAGIGRWLIVEFVPKADSQVQRLLASRNDIFPDYTAEGFERAFCQAFTLHERVPIEGSQRIMYLFEKKEIRE
jgi:ribosomal protein L11 methylase PrmA